MKMKISLLLLSIIFIFVSCNNNKPKSISKEIVIGFSMDSFIEERKARDRDVFTAQAAALGAKVIVQVADESIIQQQEQIRFLIKSGVDSLVIIPASPRGLEIPISEAKRQNIPVISYDKLVQNSNVDLYLAFDSEEAGKMQAEHCLKTGKAKRILLYSGSSEEPASIMMRNGIMTTLADSIANNNTKIIADYSASLENRSENAYAVADKLIKEGKYFDSVLAYDDISAEAIIKALSVNRLSGTVFVAGSDAELAACQRIAEGTQAMTIYKPIDQIASKAAELAIYLAKGERVTVHNGIWDGAYRIPFYELTPIAVTKENLKETIVDDGFHLEEDVFRNVLTQ